MFFHTNLVVRRSDLFGTPFLLRGYAQLNRYTLFAALRQNRVQKNIIGRSSFLRFRREKR
jgi:hypothetical protein